MYRVILKNNHIGEVFYIQKRYLYFFYETIAIKFTLEDCEEFIKQNNILEAPPIYYDKKGNKI